MIRGEANRWPAIIGPSDFVQHEQSSWIFLSNFLVRPSMIDEPILSTSGCNNRSMAGADKCDIFRVMVPLSTKKSILKS
jgi:hypothetical protein